MKWDRSIKGMIMSLPLLCAACAALDKPKDKVSFYTLEYDPPKAEARAPAPYALKVIRFSVDPVYNTHQIIYRDKQFKREAYVFHRWRANPGDLVTSFLRRDLGHSGLFEAVFSHDTRVPCSYRLEGSVDEFLEWDEAENWNAVLAVSVTLLADNEQDITKQVLFQKSYRAAKACEKKNPAALARAMSGALSEISVQIQNDVYDSLNSISMKSGGLD